MKTIRTALSFTAVIVIAYAAQAVNFLGVGGSGSGDLATGENWDGGSVPTGSSTAFIKGGELTASAPLTFSQTSTIAADGPLVYNLANAVTFGSIQNWKDGAYIVVSNGTQLTVAQKFDLGNKSGSSSISSGGAKLLITGSGSKFTQSDSGVNYGVFTGRGNNNEIELADGGYLSVNRQMIVSGAAAEYRHRLVVGEGCTAYVKPTSGGWSDTAIIGNSGYGNAVDLYGTWSSPSGYYKFYLGYGASSSNNVFTVYNGGSASMVGHVYIGNSGSGNRLVVKNGGTFRQTDNSSGRGTFIGQGANSSNNLVTVEQGGNFSSSASMYVGVSGSHNTFESRQVTLQKACIGQNAGSDHNLYHVYAPGQSIMEAVGNITFGAGRDNLALIEGCIITNKAYTDFGAITDGNVYRFKDAELYFQNGVKFPATGGVLEFSNTKVRQNSNNSVHVQCVNGHDQTIRFTDSADVSFQTGFIVGGTFSHPDVQPVSASRNRIEVVNSATAVFNWLDFAVSDNVLLISNATARVNSAFSMPYALATYPACATNNVIRFEGATPKFTVNGALNFRYGTATDEQDNEVVNTGYGALDYALPFEPYAEAPLKATSVTLSRTTKIRVSKEKDHVQSTRKYLLAEATGSAANQVITIADMNELGSELPSGYQLFLSADSKKMYLSVPGTGSTMFILR